MKRYKSNKQLYYLCGYARWFTPRIIWHWLKPNFEKQLELCTDADYIQKRVAYYNKLSVPFKLSAKATRLNELNHKNARTMYLLDVWRSARWFDKNCRWNTAFGDVNYVAKEPCIAKSRPLTEQNGNNVLLKLNRYRHFNFINDPYTFEEKCNSGVFRADIGDPDKQNRVEFMERYFGSSICNCGSIRNMEHLPKEWLTPKMSIGEMLKYKYVLTLEGNDVATNLKWVMSSQSIAVMPKPTCETWFMEGTLIPNVHYIEIKSDFSDLEERLNYYTNHPNEAEEIIANAHQYIQQFKNEKREELIEYLVLKKYFMLSGQL